MAQTNYAGISQRTAAWADTTALKHAGLILVLSKLAQSKLIPKNTADNVKFRRPNVFTVSTAPLTEGVTPTAQALTYTDVPVTLSQYGAVTEITDRVADTVEDPVLKDVVMLSGEQAAETVEQVCWGAIVGGTNVVYAGAVANRAALASVLALNDVRAAVRALKSSRGKQITRVLGASVSISTEAVEAGYVAVGHTDLDADIRSLPGFVPVAKYGSRQPLCPEELGSAENVRFITSPLLSPTTAMLTGVTSTSVAFVGGDGASATADAYPLIVLAQEAFGAVALKGSQAINTTVLNPGVPSKSDPLGQRGYVGWKTYHAAKILNETWIQRIEVLATAL